MGEEISSGSHWLKLRKFVSMQWNVRIVTRSCSMVQMGIHRCDVQTERPADVFSTTAYPPGFGVGSDESPELFGSCCRRDPNNLSGEVPLLVVGIVPVQSQCRERLNLLIALLLLSAVE